MDYQNIKNLRSSAARSATEIPDRLKQHQDLRYVLIRKGEKAKKAEEEKNAKAEEKARKAEEKKQKGVEPKAKAGDETPAPAPAPAAAPAALP